MELGTYKDQLNMNHALRSSIAFRGEAGIHKATEERIAYARYRCFNLAPLGRSGVEVRS